MNPRTRVLLAGLLVAGSAGFAYLSWNWTPIQPPDIEPPPAEIQLPFTSNDECAACHREISDEWSESMHALAWNDPIFQGEAKGREDCFPCHVPEPILETGIGKRTLARKADRRHGIGCVECHMDRRRGMVGAVPADVARPGGTCIPVQDKRIAQPEFCAPCHDQHDTMKEWRASQWPEAEKDCNTCHMPEVRRAIVPGGKVRVSHRHDFWGGHNIEGFEERFGEAPVVVLAGFSASDRVLTVSIQNTFAGHNFPTDARFRVARLVVDIADAGGNALAPAGLLRRVNADGSEFRTDNPVLRPEVPPLIEHFQYVFRDLGGEKNTLPSDDARIYYYRVSPKAVSARVRLLYDLVPPGTSKNPPPTKTLSDERVDLTRAKNITAPRTSSAPPVDVSSGPKNRVWPAPAQLHETAVAEGEPPALSPALQASLDHLSSRTAYPFIEGEAPAAFRFRTDPDLAAFSKAPASALAGVSRRLLDLTKNAASSNGAGRAWLVSALGVSRNNTFTDVIAWRLEDPDPLVQATAAVALLDMGDRSALVRIAERQFTTMDLRLNPGDRDRFGNVKPPAGQRNPYAQCLVGRTRARLGNRAGFTAMYDYWSRRTRDPAAAWLIDEMRAVSGRELAHDPADAMVFYRAFSQWWGPFQGTMDLSAKAMAQGNTNRARLEKLLGNHVRALGGFKYFLQDRSRWVFRFLEDLGVPTLKAVMLRPKNQQALLGALAAVSSPVQMLLPYDPRLFDMAADLLSRRLETEELRGLEQQGRLRAPRLEAARLLGWARDMPRGRERDMRVARRALETALDDRDREIVLQAVESLGRNRDGDAAALRGLLRGNRFDPEDYQLRLLVEYAVIRIEHVTRDQPARYKGRAPFYRLLAKWKANPASVGVERLEYAVRKLLEGDRGRLKTEGRDPAAWQYHPREHSVQDAMEVVDRWLMFLEKTYPEEIAAYGKPEHAGD